MRHSTARGGRVSGVQVNSTIGVSAVVAAGKPAGRRGRRQRALAAAAGATALGWLGALAPAAHASNQYYDGDQAGPPNGGFGIWATSVPDWTSSLTGTAYANWSNTANNDALFTGPGGVTQVVLNQTANSLSFTNATGNYLLMNLPYSTNSITITTGIIDTGSNTVEIFDKLSGTNGAGLTKNGTGTLIFHGANNFTGPVVINAGTLALGNNAQANIPDSSSVTVAAGATLDFGIKGGAYSDTFATLNGGGNVHLGALLANINTNLGTSLTVNGSNNATFTGTLTGGGRINKSGLGTWTLGGTNTYAGWFSLGGGTVSLSSDTALPSDVLFIFNGGTATLNVGAANATVGALTGSNIASNVLNLGGGSLTIGGANQNATFNGLVTGNGRIVKVGSGVQAFASQANTWTGGLTVKGGTFLVDSDAALGASPANATQGSISLDGGTFGDGTSSFTLAATRGIDVTANNGGIVTTSDLSYDGVITGPGTLTKTGSDAFALSAEQAITGGFVILDGTVSSTLAPSAGVGHPLGTGSIAVSGATITLAPTSTGGDVNLALASGAGKTFAYGPGSALVVQQAGNNSVTVTIGDPAAASSTLAASPGGTLLIGPAGGLAQLGSNTGVRVLVKGGVPVANGIVSPSIIGFDNVGGEFLSYDATNGFAQATYSPQVDINAADNKTVFEATGSTVNALTGNATVYSLVNRGVSISGAGTLHVGNGAGAAGVILNGGGDVSTGTLDFGAAQGVIFTAQSGGAVNAVITGSGGLAAIGPGTLSINAPATYTGSTYVGNGVPFFSPGRLSLGVDNALPETTALNVTGPSTVSLNDHALTVTALNGNDAASTVDIGNGTLTIAGAGRSTFLGTIAGGGNGTLAVDGAYLQLGQDGQVESLVQNPVNNSYNKLVVRNGGTVSVSAASALGNQPTGPVSDVITLDGGTLRFNTFNVDTLIPQTGTVSAFPVGNYRGITLGANGGTIDVPQAKEIIIYNGTGDFITGAGNLVKTGAGFFRIAANNTYTGKTIVHGGNLQFAADSALGPAPATLVPDQLTVDNGAEFQPNGGTSSILETAATRGIYIGTGGATLNLSNGPAQFDGPISGPGALTVVGGGVSIFNNANNTFNGLVLTNARSEFPISNSAGTGTITIKPQFPVIVARTVTNGADTVLNNPIFLGDGSMIEFRVDPSTTNGHVGSLVLTGKISGPNNLYKSSGGSANPGNFGTNAGQGTLVLSNSGNDYTGNTIITLGNVVVTANNALGATTAGTAVYGGAALDIQGGVNYAAPEPLALAGAGFGTNTGALTSVVGVNRFAGPVSLMQNTTVSAQADSLELAGNISGRSALTTAGKGTVILSGDNSLLLGGINVATNTLSVSSGVNLGSPTAVVTLNNGTLLATAGFTATQALTVAAAGGTVTNNDAANPLVLSGALTTNGTLTVAGPGAVTLAQSGTSTASNLTVATGSTLNVQAGTTLNVTGTLNVNDGGSVNLLQTAGVGLTHTVNLLNLNTTGRLDLGNHALVTNTPLSTIQQYAINGYAGGAWNGAGGIGSSYAAANHSYGVGYGTNSAGQTIAKVALLGDTTLKGSVGFGDYQTLLANFGKTSGALWSQGDTNYDGAVGFGDYQTLLSNFGKTSAIGAPQPGGTASPADAKLSGSASTAGTSSTITPAVAGVPTVTLTITADLATHTYQVFATDSTGDNAGLATFGIDIVGAGGATVVTSKDKAPRGFNADQGLASGFSTQASNGAAGIEVTASQALAYAGGNDPTQDALVYQHVGQQAGSQDGATWAQPVLIANGTFTGDVGTLTANVHPGDQIQVLGIVSNGQWQGPGNVLQAGVVPSTVVLSPEPTSLGLLAVGAGGLLARRRRRRETAAK